MSALAPHYVFENKTVKLGMLKDRRPLRMNYIEN